MLLSPKGSMAVCLGKIYKEFKSSSPKNVNVKLPSQNGPQRVPSNKCVIAYVNGMVGPFCYKLIKIVTYYVETGLFCIVY